MVITPDGAVTSWSSNLTLVPATAEYRIMTLQYAMETVRANLTFGVGHSGDGRSALVAHRQHRQLLAVARSRLRPSGHAALDRLIGLHLWRVMMATGLDATAAACRSGHLIALVGLIFTLTTVHLWGAANVMVMAYLGAGAWIYAPPAEAARRLRRRAPAPLARAKEAGAPWTPPPPRRSRPGFRAPAAGGTRRGSTGRYGGRR